MPIEALPSLLKLTLHVHLYLPTGALHVDTAQLDSDSFQYLFSFQVEMPVPTALQAREALVQCAVAGVDEAIRKARVRFEEQIQTLERNRQQFLALET